MHYFAFVSVTYSIGSILNRTVIDWQNESLWKTANQFQGPNLTSR